MEEMYELGEFIARKKVRGVVHYLCTWEGHDDRTWEARWKLEETLGEESLQKMEKELEGRMILYDAKIEGGSRSTNG